MDLENILVVDDEEAIREVVSTMLESKGYNAPRSAMAARPRTRSSASHRTWS